MSMLGLDTGGGLDTQGGLDAAYFAGSATLSVAAKHTIEVVTFGYKATTTLATGTTRVVSIKYAAVITTGYHLNTDVTLARGSSTSVAATRYATSGSVAPAHASLTLATRYTLALRASNASSAMAAPKWHNAVTIVAHASLTLTTAHAQTERISYAGSISTSTRYFEHVQAARSGLVVLSTQYAETLFERQNAALVPTGSARVALSFARGSATIVPTGVGRIQPSTSGSAIGLAGYALASKTELISTGSSTVPVTTRFLYVSDNADTAVVTVGTKWTEAVTVIKSARVTPSGQAATRVATSRSTTIVPATHDTTTIVPTGHAMAQASGYGTAHLTESAHASASVVGFSTIVAHPVGTASLGLASSHAETYTFHYNVALPPATTHFDTLGVSGRASASPSAKGATFPQQTSSAPVGSTTLFADVPHSSAKVIALALPGAKNVALTLKASASVNLRAVGITPPIIISRVYLIPIGIANTTIVTSRSAPTIAPTTSASISALLTHFFGPTGMGTAYEETLTESGFAALSTAGVGTVDTAPVVYTIAALLETGLSLDATFPDNGYSLPALTLSAGISLDAVME